MPEEKNFVWTTSTIFFDSQHTTISFVVCKDKNILSKKQQALVIHKINTTVLFGATWRWLNDDFNMNCHFRVTVTKCASLFQHSDVSDVMSCTGYRREFDIALLRYYNMNIDKGGPSPAPFANKYFSKAYVSSH